ncbi:MAG: helicase C-terminal domain-containing protein [Verrucomicrobiota bacterium]|nr:helicase C-terminal domain-containing protein [Verrucomicrobiota bacterium]
MNIDIENRRATLNARELAEFRLGPQESGAGAGGLWRAQLGQVWHKEMETRAPVDLPGAKVLIEVALKGIWLHEDWTLVLQGRMDQVAVFPNRTVVREVKTIRRALPCDPEDLRTDYPEYFAQLAVYVALLPLQQDWLGQSISGELVFVDHEEGLAQVVPLSRSEAEGIVRKRVAEFGRFLESRAQARKRLRALEFRPAFTSPRPGQETILEELDATALRNKLIFFEAPTGYGKTGIALEFALSRLREGRCDRILYLTGKSTGQVGVVKQLDAMTTGGAVHYYQMRSKADHAINSARHSCDAVGGCREEIEALWMRSGINPDSLLASGTIDLDSIRALGAQTGVCPYEIARAVLPFAEVWIADYNYLFSPRHRMTFAGVPGFAPEHTLLIVDEAHNLPSRAADAFSCEVDAMGALRVAHELELAGAPALLRSAWEQYLHWLQGVVASEQHGLDVEYALRDLVSVVCEALVRAPLEPDDFTPDAWNTLWSALHLKSLLLNEGVEKLLWSPAHATLKCTCLSAAPEIASVLHEYGQALIMSATLAPLDNFRAACGLHATEGQHLPGTAIWRDGAYHMGVDIRVDTRMKSRARFYAATAETIISATLHSREPIAVFFPSYRYADEVRARVEALDSFVRIVTQPRGAPLEEQTTFIDEALLSAHALFLVLGTGFGEGIDVLGGKVRLAIVVGPALPEVNAAQNARMENRNHLPRATAFREVYLIPAMTKINQALGRLVRAPGQSAAILLHCQRFAAADYQALLAPEYRDGTVIKDMNGLDSWVIENTRRRE